MFGKWDTTFTDFEMIFCLCRRPGCSIWEVPKGQGLTTEKHWTESKWPAFRDGDITGLNWVPNGGEKMPNTGSNCLLINGLKSTTQLPLKTLLLRYYETNALTSLSYSRALGSMRTGGGGVSETLRWYEDIALDLPPSLPVMLSPNICVVHPCSLCLCTNLTFYKTVPIFIFLPWESGCNIGHVFRILSDLGWSAAPWCPNKIFHDVHADDAVLRRSWVKLWLNLSLIEAGDAEPRSVI